MSETPHRAALAAGERAGLAFRVAPPRAALRGAAGTQAGTQRGVSLDFSDYREYHPGDDIRSLDWNVYARTDKLTVKLYHEEVSPHVDLVLDASQSMALTTAKRDALLGLGAFLAAAAATGDCSWNAFGLADHLAPIPRGRDVPSLWDAPDFSPRANPGAGLEAGAARLKRQSIRVLVSDLLWEAEPTAVLRRLSENASSLVVVQLLSRDDLEPPAAGKYRLDDAETGEALEVFIDADAHARYLAALETHTQLWDDACRHSGATHCRLVAEELLETWNVEPLLRAGVLQHQGGAAC